MNNLTGMIDLEVERNEGQLEEISIKYIAKQNQFHPDEPGDYEIEYSAHDSHGNKELPIMTQFLECDNYYANYVTDHIIEDITFNH